MVEHSATAVLQISFTDKLGKIFVSSFLTRGSVMNGKR